MVDNWEVRFAAKVLGHSNCEIQVEYNMPITTRNKYSLARLLKDFDWLTIFRPVDLLAARVHFAEPRYCFVALLSSNCVCYLQQFFRRLCREEAPSLKWIQKLYTTSATCQFNHTLWPKTRAFQADVPNGSIWMPVPLRDGPMTNQRYGGRRDSPAYLKRSSRKYFGTM